MNYQPEHIALDISPDFEYDEKDAYLIAYLMRYEKTPAAVLQFSQVCHKFQTNYAYWFMLSSLWVSYTGWSDLELWKKLFSSGRPQRHTSIMKPSELLSLAALPDMIPCFRSPRTGEQDWISYTTDFQTAIRFARKRESRFIDTYLVNKASVLAYFTRRGESELLVLDKSLVIKTLSTPVAYYYGKR